MSHQLRQYSPLSQLTYLHYVMVEVNQRKKLESHR
nr:MAG TPA: hypothetical protein [Caudoviricetes sp.]